ncbi:MAG: patatin-like phospholipase family protein [Proteobacteria bacterium]|nr:patatin-like phospholipase family protein [Pseudomonadota bacterium]
MPEKQVCKLSGHKHLNLALQGGGAHGAFTWGVLDRLLEEDSLSIDGITATSAGAMNAALAVYGIAKGGAANGVSEAKKAMDMFWRKVSAAAVLSPLQPTIFDKMMGNTDMSMSPSFMAMDYLTRMFSPYQLNYFDLNPLEDVLKEVIDFDILQQSNKRLFINATNVLSGKIKVFEVHEIDAKVLMASACLPFIFKTVEIDGQPYWDGGYSGNPALFPLIYSCNSTDVLIVQINAVNIDHVPTTANDIMNRVNEISFNSNLMREVRAISFVSKLLKKGKVKEDEYKDIRLHLIEADEIMAGLGHASKFNADWDFLVHLKEIGRQSAEDWVKKNAAKVGCESSVDIKDYFL